VYVVQQRMKQIVKEAGPVEMTGEEIAPTLKVNTHKIVTTSVPLF
jgi:hypothetical protein